jgi:hypothetical protein
MATTIKDWFRKVTWSEADQADFFAHIERSRSAGNKAQYLRIQASHLEETHKPELIQVAITLLDKMLAEFPAQGELASAQKQKGSCFAVLGRTDEAIASYRDALDTERKFPMRRTRAWLEFGRFICDRGLVDMYDEASAVLDELKYNLMFAADVFEFSGIRAIIAKHKGNSENARQFAKSALESAAATHSGFRYHPTAGLVRDRETQFYKSVEAIALN